MAAQHKNTQEPSSYPSDVLGIAMNKHLWCEKSLQYSFATEDPF